ncbi:hypothetical protein AgCh_007229 [Apium graveolens]
MLLLQRTRPPWMISLVEVDASLTVDAPSKDDFPCRGRKLRKFSKEKQSLVVTRQMKLSKASVYPLDRRKELKFSSRIPLQVCRKGGYHVLDESTMYISGQKLTPTQLWRQPIGILEVGILSTKGLLLIKMKDGHGSTNAYCVAKYSCYIPFYDMTRPKGKPAHFGYSNAKKKYFQTSGFYEYTGANNEAKKDVTSGRNISSVARASSSDLVENPPSVLKTALQTTNTNSGLPECETEVTRAPSSKVTLLSRVQGADGQGTIAIGSADFNELNR